MLAAQTFGVVLEITQEFVKTFFLFINRIALASLELFEAGIASRKKKKKEPDRRRYGTPWASAPVLRCHRVVTAANLQALEKKEHFLLTVSGA